MIEKEQINKKKRITPDMTILDVISRYPETEAVFNEYDKKVGTCLCCHALFNTLENVANQYHINMVEFISELESSAKGIVLKSARILFKFLLTLHLNIDKFLK